jgi:manganese/zinc/iron transport system permease protein
MLSFVILPYVIAISLSFSIALGCVSAYSVVKKWSLIGDVISHAAFPGIIYMFFFTHNTHIALLFLGGLISSLISILLSFYIHNKKLIPKDSAFALVLSCFFSLGIIGLSLIQKKHISGQSILNNFMYGNLLTISTGQAFFYISISCIIGLFFIFTREIQKMIAFDKIYAQTKLDSIVQWETAFLVFSIASIVISLQAVGILLMSSLVIIPGTIARIMSTSYTQMMFVSILIAALSFLGGITMSMIQPSIPTGPLIVLATSLLFFITLIASYLKKGFK